MHGKWILIVAMALLAGCAEPLTEAQSVYAGLWKNESTSLLITRDGRVEFETRSGSTSRSFSGPIKALDGQRLKAGFAFIKAEFELDGPPVVRDGMEMLLVDGEALFRTDAAGTLAKARTLPPLEDIRRLVATELDSLSGAIVSGDFKDHLAQSSLAMQSQFSAEELAGRYAVFTDRGIDLRDHMVGDFVLSAEPFIDDNGVLTIEGRYQEGPMVLAVNQTYVFSAPQWKSLGGGIDLLPRSSAEIAPGPGT